MSILNALVNLLFPAHCVGCNKRGTFLCAECLAGIPRIQNESVLFSYRHPLVQKTIILAKYRRAFRSLLPFVEPAAHYIFKKSEYFSDIKKPIVLVPIPSAKHSARKRGFSHTHIFAKELARAYPDDFMVCDILLRARKTKKQTECATRDERMSNMHGAFSARGALLPDTLYVIIDDVITTGATKNAAVLALTHAGARHLFPFALAYQELL